MGKRPTTSDNNTPEHDEFLRSVGARLREAREKTKLSQKQLGEKANVKQSYIFELETGGANMTLRTLAKMADVFEMNARDLLPEDRESAPSVKALGLLHSLLERIASLISKRESEDTRREHQDSELLAELRAFADLRFALQRNLPEINDPQAGQQPGVIGVSREPHKRTH